MSLKMKEQAKNSRHNQVIDRKYKNPMNYLGVLTYLKDLETRGINPGLENTQELLKEFPHIYKDFQVDMQNVCFIQVAGTNGKGSTAYFLASILQAAGYSVGLFTSPHLHDLRERIGIDKQWISRRDFSTGICSIKALAEDLLKRGLIGQMPSYFEYTFLLAIYYFTRERVDFAILEVGLGGRWDATSALTPGITVITTIARDHTMILGKRLGEIAGEKAGIIKKGVPLVCGCKVGSIAHRVIKNRATQAPAPFFNVIDSKNHLEIQDNHSYHCSYITEAGDYTFEVRLNGIHQAFNAAAAVKVIQVLSHNHKWVNVSKTSIRNGIADTFVPARIETLDTTPQVILDGSHNVHSITALAQFLKEKKKNCLTLVFGVLADKNYRGMIALLLPYIHRVILTEPVSTRALPVEKMLKLFKDKVVLVRKNPGEAYRSAQEYKDDILIAGSFYLVGELRKIILAGG
jgi:dihydrofolate synthase/folylpolyglutamate synthase